MHLIQERKEIAKIAAKLAALKAAIKREKEEIKKAAKASQDAIHAQTTLQRIAQGVQRQAHKRICDVVSSCLSIVFDKPYAFHIEFERKRGKTEAKLLFLRDGLEVDPISSSGGGMIDVAAFALRVACLVLHRPRLSKLLVLDEPFRFVSSQFQDNVRQMLEELSKDMKIQIVMVTHNPNLATGKIVNI
jgi:DNA repair exonuclease SbcCD ATPase subunit